MLDNLLTPNTFCMLLQHVQHIVWSAKPDGKINYVNNFCLEVLGTSFEALLEDGWLNRVHPQDLDSTIRVWENAVMQGEAYQIEFRLRVKDGSYRWHLAKASPIFNIKREIILWVGTGTDIHELKLSDAANQEINSRLDLAMESAQAGFWSWDLIKNSRIWDRHIFKLFGREEFDLPSIHSATLQIIHPLDRDLVSQQIRTAIEAKHDFASEFRVVWPDESVHWVASRARLILDEQGQPQRLMGFCWNIDEQKKTELWKQTHRTELAEVAKLSSSREVASRLAHELNQPLTALSMYLEGCLELLNAGEYTKLAEPLQKANIQAQRAGEITHRMKDFVKQLRLQRTLTDITKLIVESVELVKHETKVANIKFVYEFANDIPRLNIDKIQLQQVIINLLRNSIEAISDAKMAKAMIKLIVINNGSALEVSVLDDGPGIVAQTKEKLFSPYYTTKHYGMGLGLAICQSIVEAHGGIFHDVQQPSRGSLIKFSLPLLV